MAIYYTLGSEGVPLVTAGRHGTWGDARDAGRALVARNPNIYARLEILKVHTEMHGYVERNSAHGGR